MSGSSSFAATNSTKIPPQASSRSKHRRSQALRGSFFPRDAGLLFRGPPLLRGAAAALIRRPACREVMVLPPPSVLIFLLTPYVETFQNMIYPPGLDIGAAIPYNTFCCIRV